MTTDHEIAQWRLRSQRLVAPFAGSSEEVVGHLLAVQAENAGQAAWAVACRTRTPDAADLETLLSTGAVLRTHVLRPTWHFVGREDIGWLLELTAPRIRPIFHRQVIESGLRVSDLDRVTSAVLDTLEQQPHQTRDDVAQGLAGAGFTLSGHTLMLLLGMLEVDRLICSGRPSSGAHTYARFADRVGDARRLDREEGLAELALRYFTGHGPATVRDLAYWATSTVTDVRRGLSQVADRLASFEHDGRTFWHAPDQEPPTQPLKPRGHLLQILDELYRGYQESRMVLDAAKIVPMGRESAIGMALVDGQMVAGMKRTVARKAVFDLTPYDGALTDDQREVLEDVAGRYGGFLGLEAELRVR